MTTVFKFGKSTNYLLMASVAVAASGVTVVHAQSRAVIEEVVVTAQRREQSMQDVPLAVSSFDARGLGALGIPGSMELKMATPGLNVTQRAGSTMPSIRGVTTPNTGPGAEASVATYVDGVYYQVQGGNLLSLAGIERVEVLKGPQGTLFGRNSSGGILHIITKNPSAEPEAQASVSHGRFGTTNANLYANVGGDTLAANVAVSSSNQREGWGKNLFTGEEVNIHEEQAIRAKVLWKPSDTNEVLLSYDYSTRDSDIGRSRKAFPGSILIDGQVGTEDYNINADHDSVNYDQYHWGVSLKYSHFFDWGTFSSLTSHRKFHSDFTLDNEGSTQPITNARLFDNTESTQQEFLFVGSREKLDWTAGLFFYQSEAGFDPLRIWSPLVAGANFETFGMQELFSYAGFAELTYAITERTGVTAGIRYTVDERDLDGVQVTTDGFPLGAGVVLATANKSKTIREPTWKLALDHQFSDEVMAYASYSRGFKSGEFNSGNLAQDATESEIVDAYEVGMKTDLLDNSLRLNFSAYYYDFKDIQLFTLDNAITTVFNAASAEIKGMEAEAIYVTEIGRGLLELRSGLSVIDAEYDDFPAGVSSRPTGVGGNIVENADLSGNKMLQVPDYTVNIGFDYSIPAGAGTLGFSGNYYYNDGFYWEADNRIAQDAYNVVNAKVSYAFGGDGEKYTLWLSGKNLTDEYFLSYAFSGSTGDLGSPDAPRTWAVGVDVNLF
ncbi:MAG: TonB-dependent receptor [Porticoccaceae bacterium]